MSQAYVNWTAKQSERASNEIKKSLFENDGIK